MENKLKYSSPARNFNESLLIGNGRIGAAVYGDPKKDTISLNCDTLWSGKPRCYGKDGAFDAFCRAREEILSGNIPAGQEIIEQEFNSEWSQAYMPMGTLYVESNDGDIKSYRRELDMEKAVVTVDYTSEKGSAKREYFVSHPHGCLAIRSTSENARDYVISANSKLLYTCAAIGSTLAVSGQAPLMVFPQGHLPKGREQVEYGEGSLGFTFALEIKTDGVLYSDGFSLTVSGATSLTILLCADTGYTAFNKAPDKDHEGSVFSMLSSIVKEDFDHIKAAHTSDFSSYYNRVRLDLCAPTVDKDTDLRLEDRGSDIGLYELIFNFGRYLLISSSREGTEATNLQGIWNEHIVPPWQSNYTVNINTEMNYWPVHTCALPEFFEPLVTLIKKISVNGRETAKSFYNADGFVAHHNVDIWGMTNPVGKLTRGSAVYSFWALSSGWLCRHLFEHYEYTLDKDFLRDTAYPIMKEAAKFYLCMLVKDENGKYIFTPTTSPENRFLIDGKRCAVSKWSTMSQCIIAELFGNCIRSAELLGLYDEFTSILRSRLESMQSYEIGEDGRLHEWDTQFEEADYTHRHVSNLYGLFPGETVTAEATPELAEACKKSLERRGDEGTGWGLAWKSCLWSKLGDGNRALSFIDTQLYPISYEVMECKNWGGGTYPNLLDACPPFQIDGNFGAVCAIVNMLMQYENGKIKLLPALPKSLSSGSVSGIIAKGNVKIDMAWESGAITSLVLSSPSAQGVTVVCGNEREISVTLTENTPKKII
jgi:alpha-L-fucosidase 2